MDYIRETEQIAVLQHATERYRNCLNIERQWADSKGSHPNADRAWAAAGERRAEAYAALIKAALDLFEDGDLFDKWRAACQDAGVSADD